MRRKAMWFRNKKKEGNVVFFSHIFLLILSTLVFPLGRCFLCCVCGVCVTFARLRKNNSIMLVCYLFSTIFYNVASVMKCQFVHRLYTLKKNHLCTWKKNSQYSQDTDCVPMLILSTEHLQIMRRQTIFGPHTDLCFLLIIFSWVAYWGYTSPSDCLLSARLTKTWPRKVTVNVHEQRITHTHTNAHRFKIYLVKTTNLLFYTLHLTISILAYFRPSCITVFLFIFLP